ncbi:hypothetical protein [Aeromonas rivipollensis]|uniref:hypothetical protein n=1 Tax=Aeromonas rivipollensis TaxID=948519 RepID=UPI003D224CC7
MKSTLRSDIIKNKPANVVKKEFAIHFSSRKCFFEMTKDDKTFRAFRYTWDMLTVQQNIHDPDTKKKTTVNPFWDCSYGDIKEVMKSLNITHKKCEKRKDNPMYRSIHRKLKTLDLPTDFHYAINQADKRVKYIFIIDVAGDRNPKSNTASGFIFTGVFHVIIHDEKHGFFHYKEEFYQEHEFRKGKLDMNHVSNEMSRVLIPRGKSVRKAESIVSIDSDLEQNNIVTAEVISVVNEHADLLNEQADEIAMLKAQIAYLQAKNTPVKRTIRQQKLDELNLKKAASRAVLISDEDRQSFEEFMGG